MENAGKAYVAVLKTSEGYFMMLNRDSENRSLSILGWKSLREALDYFELAYNGCHGRSYESSMSACINYIQFLPRVLEFGGLQDMIKKLNLKEGMKPVRLRSLSGNYDVMPLDAKLAETLYESAVQPRLI